MERASWLVAALVAGGCAKSAQTASPDENKPELPTVRVSTRVTSSQDEAIPASVAPSQLLAPDNPACPRFTRFEAPETELEASPLREPEGGQRLVARWLRARIHIAPDPDSTVIGYARRGHEVAARGLVSGTGCPADQWYALHSGGYACATREFRVAPHSVDDPVVLRDEALAFDYAKVKVDGAPRFDRLPTEREVEQVETALAEGGNLPDPVSTRMEGAYFVALVSEVEHEGRTYYKTYRGDFVRAQDLELLDRPRGAGALLHADDLPLALVRDDEMPVRCRCDDDSLTECGEAEPWARFRLDSIEPTEVDGVPHLTTVDGQLIPAKSVRIARPIPRPSPVGKDDRWIHVNLKDQTLVAYEGDTPVLATMVSTGVPGHTTPTGTWQVSSRYVAKTMRGPDDEHGSYTVSQVPWTLFYYRAYAVHGAYWHDEFGAVRSHGCTNVPPADARWLFDWVGSVPEGWYAASHESGPWVHVSR